jgi:hypothetical protein
VDSSRRSALAFPGHGARDDPTRSIAGAPLPHCQLAPGARSPGPPGLPGLAIGSGHGIR